MSPEDRRGTSEDPLEILCWIIERGYTVAFRSVYGGTTFHVRAVRGTEVLIREGRGLKQLMQDLRREIQPKKMER